jgi:hypothetical protein
MTQAFNLSQLANGVNTSGQLNAAANLYNQVPVANGGTNAASLAGNGALIMNAAGTIVTSLAASTAGNVLTSDGTTWVSQAGSGGTPIVTIYSAPAAWTKSPTLKAVKVTMVAGGGGGGGGSGGSPTQNGGTGGNGGIIYGFAQASAIPGPLTVTVGTGGGGGTAGSPGGSNGGVGGTGGTSSFGAVYSTTGGAGGAGGIAGGSGGGSGASGGAFSITSTATSSSLQLTSPVSPGLNAYGAIPTAGYGAGGTGGAFRVVGGSGTTGFVIVEEFY